MSRTSKITNSPVHRQAHLNATAEPAAGRAAYPGLGYEAPARPEMDRQELVVFTVYVVILVIIAAFLAATAVLWWLQG